MIYLVCIFAYLLLAAIGVRGDQAGPGTRQDLEIVVSFEHRRLRRASPFFRL